jgi:hypothetical protein
VSKINLKLILIILAAAVLLGYFLYQARGYLFGPKIIIETPLAGEVIHDSYLEVKGQAKNIALLSLNGRQIFTDEKGNFDEGLLLAHGYNIIEITAQDKFGRITKEKREVILE